MGTNRKVWDAQVVDPDHDEQAARDSVAQEAINGAVSADSASKTLEDTSEDDADLRDGNDGWTADLHPHVNGPSAANAATFGQIGGRK